MNLLYVVIFTTKCLLPGAVPVKCSGVKAFSSPKKTCKFVQKLPLSSWTVYKIAPRGLVEDFTSRVELKDIELVCR